MKIILVHPDFDKADLIAAHIQTERECECLTQTSASAALMVLKMTPDCDMLIIYDPENPKDCKKLIDYAQEQDIPTTLYLADEPEDEQILYEDDLTKLVPSLLNYFPQKQKTEAEGYLRIHIDHLQYITELPVEISLIINKKYVTILKKGDPLTSELIDKYKKKKVRYVYLKDYDHTAFQKILAKRYKALLTHGDDQEFSVDKIQQGVFDLLIDFGIDPETTELAKEATEQILNKISNSPSLKEQLKELYSKKASFRFKLNYMTSMIAHTLVADPKNTWVKDQHKEAIIYASMFNDITLKKEKWVIIRHEDDLSDDLPAADKETILKHALDSTKRHQEIDGIPPETLKVIMQHHGTLNGIGFSRTLTGPTALHPLTYFFIVAEEFSIKVLTSKDKKVNIPSILKEIQQLYSHKKIDEVLAILQQNLK